MRPASSVGIVWLLLAAACSEPAPTAALEGLDGAALFSHAFTVEEGLGPLFNARSCVACHSHPEAGGTQFDDESMVLRVAAISSDGTFDVLEGRGGPVARHHSVAELGEDCSLRGGVGKHANAVSLRAPLPLFGDGAIEAIADSVIIEGALNQDRASGLNGRVAWVGEHVGRFGWKAQTPSVNTFVADALRDELGITNPLRPLDLVDPVDECAGFHARIEAEAVLVEALSDFVRELQPPAPLADDAQGEALFAEIGCAGCHVPSLPSPAGAVRLYSDLLLHDMGPALNDGFVQGAAGPADWRTTPLWGLRARTRFLHDARAGDVDSAIRSHGGEASASLQRYLAASAETRARLLAFLEAL